MRHERQVELLRRLKGIDPNAPWPLAAATLRNSANHYVDPARFERERQVLFRQCPQLIGLGCEVAEPGSSLTANLGGVPIAVVRQHVNRHPIGTPYRHAKGTPLAGCFSGLEA